MFVSCTMKKYEWSHFHTMCLSIAITERGMTRETWAKELTKEKGSHKKMQGSSECDHEPTWMFKWVEQATIEQSTRLPAASEACARVQVRHIEWIAACARRNPTPGAMSMSYHTVSSAKEEWIWFVKH